MHAISGTVLVYGKQIQPDGSPSMESGVSPIAKSSELSEAESEPVRRRNLTARRIPRGTGRYTVGAPPTSGRDRVPTTRSPVPVPEVACIHDLSKRKITVRIEPGDGVSTTLTGNFDAHHTARVWYELVHPQYLFGNSYLPQSVRFCPRPSDADD